ncbi:MAG TPA: GerMN domain-containing protein [Pyrinomonadaceae bacterium]|nr:GerMN domain-containing protein [Pyrinomonadaceae bacterium]
MLRFTLLLLILCLAGTVERDSSATAQTGTMTIKVYYANEKRNPNADPCGLVFPVNRVIPKTSGVARAALEQLFAGPTEKEKAEGYYSWFNPETKAILKSVVVKNRTAYVNFKQDTFAILSGNVSTSCGSDQFISEMEKTLRQFPSIKKIFYAIDGKPQDFYEFLQGECPEELGKTCDGSNFQ